MGLWYPKGSRFELTAFSDADDAGCIDSCKSTSGGIQFLGDKLVSWMSKKHNCTAMSLAEAEYVTLSASCAQVLWMKTKLQDYGFNYNKIPLYCDSQSAIAISCNPIQHSHTNHIHTRYHFLKEQVENGIIELYFVRTEYQLADMFTKALLEDRFKYLVRCIDGNPYRAIIKQALGRRSYALSWKPYQGDSLNPPDHRYSIYTIKWETGGLDDGVAASFPQSQSQQHMFMLKRQRYTKHQELRIKNQESLSNLEPDLRKKKNYKYPPPNTGRWVVPVMSSDNASSAVTYTSISSDLDGPSWGISLVNTGELPEIDPYEEVSQQGQEPPLSPSYVLDLMELDEHVPVYVPKPEHPEYHVPSYDDMQVEDQRYASDASLIDESPGHIADSESMEEDSIDYPDKPEDDDEDPEEDPTEDHTDYPANGGDDDDEPSDDENDNDDTDDKDEEHTKDEDDDELEPPISVSIEARIAEHATAPMPPTSLAYDRAPLGYRTIMLCVRDDIPKKDMPPRRRFVLAAPPPRAEDVDYDDASQSLGGGLRRPVQPAHVCFYIDFIKCQPLNFKRTKGVVGLSQWLKNMESVFHINGCAVDNQVKFTTCTLHLSMETTSGMALLKEELMLWEEEMLAQNLTSSRKRDANFSRKWKQPKGIIPTEYHFVPKAEEYLSKGCDVFLAHITTKEAKDKLEGKRLEDVSIVREFAKVFPKDLPGTEQVNGEEPLSMLFLKVGSTTLDNKVIVTLNKFKATMTETLFERFTPKVMRKLTFDD
nr:retrovirus-related Pol polyprotein from transposon TNT 1-94 [Tanacetum cinerariifolium]